MLKLTVNNHRVVTLEPLRGDSFKLNDIEITPDIAETGKGLFHVLLNNKSYTAEVIKHDRDEKLFHIRVNSNIYKIQARDKYDALLKELGFDAGSSKKASDLKAPMPGLVVDVAVSDGQEVKKGDKLIVLEAMKMENILKADSDGIIKSVRAKKGSTVEKNEILILFS